jgi:glycosyltransferase involved in cell wall biosynthesis
MHQKFERNWTRTTAEGALDTRAERMTSESLTERPRPKVSVAMITYNHERFIAQAIESALAQTTDFPFEIVIGDDASTDRTPEIVRRFAERFPMVVHARLGDRNVGINRNLTETIHACRGEYVALLEGDDYWTAAYKLQAQSEFLDRNPECASCFHNARILRDAGPPTELYNHPDQRSAVTLEDLLDGNFIATCSVMFRAALLARLPAWFHPLEFGDWPLHIICAQHGTIGYLGSEPMGVYRVHPHGAWSRLSVAEGLQKLIAFYRAIDPALEARHHDRIRRRVLALYEQLATEYQARREPGKAMSCGIRALLAGRAQSEVPLDWAWRIVLRPCTRWLPAPARRLGRKAAGQARRWLYRRSG